MTNSHTADSGTPNEELASAVSHGVGLLGAIAATPVLIVGAARGGTAADIVGSSIFGAMLIVLYLASTWYHASPLGRRRDRLRRFDHAAIYLLIAGTYTPFTLGVLGGGWGWTLFGLVWGAAVLGVLTKIAGGARHSRLSAAMYVAMGWLVLIAIRPLMLAISSSGLAWLVAGGLFYTAGVAFYLARERPYAHAIWHLFVLAGSTCHFCAVYWHAA